MHRHATLGDTVYFWFAANLTTGTAGDGASPTFDVRKGGAASSAAPTYEGTPTLLSHANYSDGSYEIAVPATGGNGFEADAEYGVFCSLLISSVNPNGFVGSLSLKPVVANVKQWLDTAPSTPNTAGVPKVDQALWLGTAPLALSSQRVQVLVNAIAANAVDASALATDAAQELAALIETYIVNEGDATAVLQAVADKIAADWVAGDASPLAVAAAVWASATRTLTANPGLDAGALRAAIGLATPNLDTQLTDLPTVSEFEARTLLSAAYSTATKLLSLVQSLARNDVTVDPDIGGTFSDANHSLQAIRARGDVAWITGEGGGGGGASYAVRTSLSPGEVASEKLVCHYKRAKSFTFYPMDDAGDPIVPSGTYRFAVALKSDPDTLLFEITGIDDIDATSITVDITAEHTETITDDGSGQVYLYSLDGETDQGLIASNVFICRGIPTTEAAP